MLRVCFFVEVVTIATATGVGDWPAYRTSTVPALGKGPCLCRSKTVGNRLPMLRLFLQRSALSMAMLLTGTSNLRLVIRRRLLAQLKAAIVRMERVCCSTQAPVAAAPALSGKSHKFGSFEISQATAATP